MARNKDMTNIATPTQDRRIVSVSMMIFLAKRDITESISDPMSFAYIKAVVSIYSLSDDIKYVVCSKAEE